MTTLKNGLDHLGKLRQLGKMCINTDEDRVMHQGAKNARHTFWGEFFTENP